MLPLNEPLVGLAIALFKEPLCRDSSGESVSTRTFAWQNHLQNAVGLVAEAVNFADGTWKVG